MKIEKLPDLFIPAKPVLQKIEQAGFEAYFVGGSVRDTILGDPIHDIDIATSAYPSEIKTIFKRTVDTGIEHGTVMILDHGQGYETTTFRTESGYQDYRRPDHVTFVRSLKDDLKRRDFTINALAMKENGEVIDLFAGLDDLNKHLIKAVGNPEERFHEDALRMMRAVRFASKLDFVIDKSTLKGIVNNAQLLEKIAIERIQVEFTKLLLGLNPAKGLRDFIDTGLFKYCPGFESYEDGLNNLAKISDWSMINNEVDAWVALVFVLKVPLSKVNKLLCSWKLSNDLINQVNTALRMLVKFNNNSWSITDLFSCGLQGLRTACNVANFVQLGIDTNQVMADYKALPIHDKHELTINGGNLIKEAGVKPGPNMGRILTKLLNEVVTGKVINDHDALLKRTQSLLKEE